MQVVRSICQDLTPKGAGVSKAAIDACDTEDAEMVNGFGVYAKGRDAMFAAGQQAAGADGTVGLSNQVVSATLLASNVILAHMLATAEIPSGPRAGKVQSRFTHVIVNQNGAWKMRSSTTTLVQPLPTPK